MAISKPYYDNKGYYYDEAEQYYSGRQTYTDSEGNIFANKSDRDASTRRIRERKLLAEESARRTARSARKQKTVAKAATLSRPMASAVAALPRKLQPVVREIVRDTAMNSAMTLLMERASEFSTPTAAMLAGIALDPNARKHFDNHLDQGWKGKAVPKVASEVIIGGGLHAAIYSAVRVAMGGATPLVLERRDRVGGAFAVSANPSFYLNSRNRPGPLSVPGEMGALNVLPGSMLQPSDLGGAEYQTNDSLGWVVRLTLAMNANVLAGVEVDEIRPTDDFNFEIRLRSGERIVANRVILATGLNEQVNRTRLNSDRVMNYEQFMRRMDDPFALRGMDRVAVLGGGDGGKTVIEALAGQGPLRQFSVATLDYPQKIDWYGAPCFSCEVFVEDQRPRYRNIARLLPSNNNPERPYRVTPKGVARFYSEGFGSVYVDEVPYDYIIDATGYTPGTTVALESRSEFETFSLRNKEVGGRIVAEQGYYQANMKDDDLDLFVVGPAADLEITTPEERSLRGIAENRTSLFRYAARTAALAASLS